MSRLSVTTPRGRTTLLADALSRQQKINADLAKIDLRRLPQPMKAPVKDARLRGAEAAQALVEALQVEAQSLAVSA